MGSEMCIRDSGVTPGLELTITLLTTLWVEMCEVGFLFGCPGPRDQSDIKGTLHQCKRYRVSHDTGHLKNLAKSQALNMNWTHEYVPDFIKGLGLSQIFRCPVL